MQLPAVELKGKPLSLGAKITGALIAVSALVMKATVSPTLDIDAAIKVAAFVVLVFAPVDLSMVMGNIFGPLAASRKPPYEPYPADYPRNAQNGGGK
jgi:predicted phage tail protein